MRQSDILFLCVALAIVVIICLVTGYSSGGNGGNSPVQNASEQAVPTLAHAATTKVAGTTTSSQSLTSGQATPVISAQTSSSTGLTITINSVNESLNYDDYASKPGNTLLILNVTLTNNDPRHTITFTSSSFDIAGNIQGMSFVHPPSVLSKQFTNYISPASQETGDMVFNVNPGATVFHFFMRDQSGTVLSKVDNITLPTATLS